MAQGNISVALGRGEFGQGFYTQSSSGNAMRWAAGRSPNPAVLVIDIPAQDSVNLYRVILSLKAARSLNRRLRNRNETASYRRGCDVTEGPLVSNPQIQQYKFESKAAENLLNGPVTTRTVI
jgi:hypothetical protein